jgi:hypothetical protein
VVSKVGAEIMWGDTVRGILEFFVYVVLLAVGVISVYLYRQTKKSGFIYIGISFLLQGVWGFIPNQTILNFVTTMFGLTDSAALGSLLVVNAVVDVVIAIFALAGILILTKELKPKSTS